MSPISVPERRRQVHLTYRLLNNQGVVVLTSASPTARKAPELHRVVCRLPAGLLSSGGYSLCLIVIENGNHMTYGHNSIASFTVVDQSHREKAWMGREPGVV